MTPERASRLVAWWVRRYTRDLPAPVAERRIEEIGADLHDHIAHERAAGTSDRRIGLGIASRMLRGTAADAAWRSRALSRSSTHKEGTSMKKPAVRVALVTACVLLVPLIGMLVSDDWNWGVADFVLAALLLGGSGMLLEHAMRNPRNAVLRVAATAIGVAAIVLGEMDDAPGLVGFGCLLIIGTIALTLRTAQRST
jgi:hypothetical protein